MSRRLGVCTWSLRPGSPLDLAERVRETGCRAVQLALDPIRRGAWPEDGTVAVLEENGIDILSGMMEMAGEDYSSLDSIRRTGGVRPDETWPENLANARKNAEIARRLGIDLVTFHAGFLPHERGDRERPVLMQRLRDMADVFAEGGVRVAFETGQETAETLLDALDELDHPNIGVNFDPANMVLYDMGDPIEAMRRLAPYIAQAHVKDASPTLVAGEWGAEEVCGHGAVDWDGFFGVLREHLPDCDLLIEREQGESRVADIAEARRFVLERMGDQIQEINAGDEPGGMG